MRILVDTNILLRITDPASLQHLATRAEFDKLIEEGATLLLCTQVMIEFWVVATRPKNANGLGLSAEEAAAELADFQKLLLFLNETENVKDRWFNLVRTFNVTGKRAHDARIVALMLENQIQSVFTINKDDFDFHPAIQIRTPLPQQ
jgi:predicted nucleic acid-binding protein